MTDKALGLYVDGVLQEPVERNVRPDRSMNDHFSRYVVSIGEDQDNKVILYLDPNCLVKINSQRYLNNIERMYCTNGGYTTVIAEGIVSDDDLFLGNNTLYGTSTKGCELLNVELIVTNGVREKYELVGAVITNSRLVDTEVKGEVTMHDSDFFESSIQCTYGEFQKVTLVNSSLFTRTIMHVGSASLLECALYASEDDLFVSECVLDKVIVWVPRLSLLGIFYTFLLEFPRFKLRFVRMAKGEYALCDESGWFVKIPFEGLGKRISEYLCRFEQPHPESITHYILDCVASRIKVLEMIENYHHRELLHLTYPTGGSGLIEDSSDNNKDAERHD